MSTTSKCTILGNHYQAWQMSHATCCPASSFYDDTNLRQYQPFPSWSDMSNQTLLEMPVESTLPSLLRLPLEVRTIIYEYALGNALIYVKTHVEEAKYHGIVKVSVQCVNTEILQVSKQVRAEALPHLNSFSLLVKPILGTSRSVKQLAYIPKAISSSVSRLTISDWELTRGFHFLSRRSRRFPTLRELILFKHYFEVWVVSQGARSDCRSDRRHYCTEKEYQKIRNGEADWTAIERMATASPQTTNTIAQGLLAKNIKVFWRRSMLARYEGNPDSIHFFMVSWVFGHDASSTQATNHQSRTSL